MNYVQLVDALRVESGASGRTLTTVQGTLPAETERLKRWISGAWNDIQLQHTDWNFHYVEATHTLEVGEVVLNQTEFAAGTVAEWVVNTFRIADPGETRMSSQLMTYREYLLWRDEDGLRNTDEGKPLGFTVHPQTEAIHLSKTPDQAYQLWYDYRRTPQVLAADTDIPIIPTRYHDLIVAWALRKYGLHEVAAEKISQANEVVSRLFPALEIDQLPEVTLGTL